MRAVSWYLRPLPKFTVPIIIKFKWIEPNARRDRDNVCGGGAKVILDAMKHMGIIKNDSRRWVMDTQHDTTCIDKNNPRVELEIAEVLGGLVKNTKAV